MYASLRLPWSPNPTPAELAYRHHASSSSRPHTVRTKGTIFLPPPPDDVLRQAFHAPPKSQSRMSAGAVALTKHAERNPRPERHPRMMGREGEVERAGKGGDGEGQKGGEEGLGGEDATELNDGIHTNTSRQPPKTKTNRSDGYKSGKRKTGEGHHPFWVVPRGNNDEKTRVAGETLEKMLREARWRNVMLLHEGVAVYEVREGRGWGMRWSLALERELERGEEGIEEVAEEGVLEEAKGKRRGERDRAGAGDEDDGGSVEEVPEGDMPGWRVGTVTFRGFLEPIAGLNHELEPEPEIEPETEAEVEDANGAGQAT